MRIYLLDRSGRKQLEDVFDGLISAMIGGFDLTGRLSLRIGATLEQAGGERAADALVEEDEEKRDLGSFGGEAVSIGLATALQKVVSLHFAQVVAKLGESVGGGGQPEGSKNRLMDLGAAPTEGQSSGMKEDFHQAD